MFVIFVLLYDDAKAFRYFHSRWGDLEIELMIKIS